MTPATAMSGVCTALQRLATPTTTLPCSDWPSKHPSPENTRSASCTRSSKCAVSSTVCVPICNFEPKNATMPAPMPPAAPPPGRSSTSAPRSRFMMAAKCARPASSMPTCSGVAPFCGPKMAEAPVTPHRGLSMSHMVTISISRMRGFMPETSMREMWESVPPTGRNSAPVAS